VLKSVPAAYVTCKDYAAAHAMRAYAKPAGDDPVIVSGESGASTMGAVLMLLERPELEAARKALGLGADSVILLINTEGDTDPVSYRNIVECGAYPLP
jgi:diaminopropionate ammonia-lyase